MGFLFAIKLLQDRLTANTFETGIILIFWGGITSWNSCLVSLQILFLKYLDFEFL